MKVIVIDVCGLHVGYLGCYGNDWIATPNLDRLAAEGIVFDQHYADSPGDESGLRSRWTGRYRFPLPGAAATSNGGEAQDLPSLLEAQQLAWCRVGDAGDREQCWESACDALDRLATQDNWLLWIDLPELGPPWEMPEECLQPYFAEEADEDEEPLEPWLDPPAGPVDAHDFIAVSRLQNTYAAVVTALDDQLGRFSGRVQERGLADEMLLIITGDRGLARASTASWAITVPGCTMS